MAYAYQAGGYAYRAGGYAYRAGGIFSSIGSFLGKVGKTVAGMAGAVLPGPLGMIGRAISQPTAPRVSFFPPEPSIPHPGRLFGPGAGAGTAMVRAQHGVALGACSPNGKRLKPNKSTYVTRGGGTSRWPQELLVHPAGTECVTPRRMNPANPRALRRAISRTRGAVKLLRKAASATGMTVVSRAALARRGKAKR